MGGATACAACAACLFRWCWRCWVPVALPVLLALASRSSTGSMLLHACSLHPSPTPQNAAKHHQPLLLRPPPPYLTQNSHTVTATVPDIGYCAALPMLRRHPGTAVTHIAPSPTHTAPCSHWPTHASPPTLPCSHTRRCQGGVPAGHHSSRDAGRRRQAAAVRRPAQGL